MGKEGINTFENHTSEEFLSEKQEPLNQHGSTLKKCPFCAELIQLEAIKCKHCGEFLNGFQRRDVKTRSGRKWYYSTSGLFIFLLITGPLAFFIIPLVWLNPHYKKTTKIIVTLFIVAFSVFFIFLTIYAVQNVIEQFHQLESMGL